MASSTEIQSPPGPRWRRGVPGVVQAGALLLVFLALRVFMQRGIASGTAPALVGDDLASHRVSLEDFRGTPVLVHFWATWCPVCNAEGSTIADLAREHAVLTVATSSGDADAIRASMAKAGVSFPVVVDPEGEIARAWGVHAFPTSFFVSPSQQIRAAETGFTTSVGFRARLWLAGR